jgi:1,4-alpha-glucan branching enzyme
MALTKKYVKKDDKFKVTFRIPKEEAQEYKKASVVGDFNKWDPKKGKMTQLKSGDFKLDVKLDKGSEYQFRYIIDGSVWKNEPEADKEVPSGVADAMNSVVICE